MKRIILLVITMMPLIVIAEIYRWTDDKGNVHYGDKASDKSAVELNLKNDKKQNTDDVSIDGELTRTEKRQRILESMQEDSKERKRVKAEEKEQKKRKKQQCAQLKDKMRSLKRATGIYELDEQGDRVFVSKKRRGDGEKQLKKAIKKYCR